MFFFFNTFPLEIIVEEGHINSSKEDDDDLTACRFVRGHSNGLFFVSGVSSLLEVEGETCWQAEVGLHTVGPELRRTLAFIFWRGKIIVGYDKWNSNTSIRMEKKRRHMYEGIGVRL